MLGGLSYTWGFYTSESSINNYLHKTLLFSVGNTTEDLEETFKTAEE